MKVKTAGVAVCKAGDPALAESRCGDGMWDPDNDASEICDDGPDEGNGRCLNDCSKVQVCGDGSIDGTEVCDDGNAITEAECSYGEASCSLCDAGCATSAAKPARPVELTVAEDRQLA